MKTAISVEDDLLNEADRAAKQMGVSRSRLFSLAMETYLRQTRQAQIIEQLNKVYAGDPQTDERRIARAMMTRVPQMIPERW